MSIIIPHRFQDRLLDTDDFDQINTIILGTFNPGLPKATYLSKEEEKHFNEIKKNKNFITHDKILNFYDRSHNRFWKIMDLIENPAFYKGDFSIRNPNGLKYYKTLPKMKRDETFQSQKEFCIRRGIFITDIIKEIQPASFKNVYNNFDDKTLNTANPSFNTAEIIKLIRVFDVKEVLVTFNFENGKNSEINNNVLKIKDKFQNKVVSILSPSGAARKKIKDLFDDWVIYV